MHKNNNLHLKFILALKKYIKNAFLLNSNSTFLQVGIKYIDTFLSSLCFILCYTCTNLQNEIYKIKFVIYKQKWIMIYHKKFVGKFSAILSVLFLKLEKRYLPVIYALSLNTIPRVYRFTISYFILPLLNFFHL